MIRRAIARGELAPDIDIRFTHEMIAAPLNFEAFALGDTVDDDYLDRVVDYLVNALATRPLRHD